jgi:hypothetical protein
MQRAGAAFLMADLKLALTMLESAALLSVEKRARAHSNATSAYRNALKSCSRLTLTPKESVAIDELQEQLKCRLDRQARKR